MSIRVDQVVRVIGPVHDGAAWYPERPLGRVAELHTDGTVGVRLFKPTRDAAGLVVAGNTLRLSAHNLEVVEGI